MRTDAHLALTQLSDYRNHLDNQQDGLLVEALNRLMNVFQSRLFLGLLDIQEFYETILLNPHKTNEEKTSAALEVATRWENISSPSLVASTTDLRTSSGFVNKTNSLERARSLHQINYLSPINYPKLTKHKNNINSLSSSHQNYEYYDRNISAVNREKLFPNNNIQSFKNRSSSIEHLSSYDNIKINDFTKYSTKFNQNQYDLLNEQSSHNQPLSNQQHNYQCLKQQINKEEKDKKLTENIPTIKPRQKRLKRSKAELKMFDRSNQDLIPKSYKQDWIPTRINDNVTTTSATAIFTITNTTINNSDLNKRMLKNAQTHEVIDNEAENKHYWKLINHLPITMEIIVNKGSRGFGFSIAGGNENITDPEDTDTNIYVTRITPGGPADRESGLQLGDRILSVNGISLINATHAEAVKTLQYAGSRLKLIVERKAELAVSEADSLISSTSFSRPLYQTSCSKPNQTQSPVILSPLGPSLTNQQTHGSRESTGSAGNTSMGSMGMSATTTSLLSGSLFDHGDSKQTLNSASRPPSSSHFINQMSPLLTSSKTENKIQDITHEKHLSPDPDEEVDDQRNDGHGNLRLSTPLTRISRRGVACTGGFPAFSWCSGLQRVTSCAPSLGGHHHISQGSSASSHRTPTGSTESRGPVRSHDLIVSGARPVPIPQPGPLVIEVTLTRGTKSGLGFSITGGIGNETTNGDSGIFITKLTPGGVAETDGRISVGDRIVQVNDVQLVDVTHEEAVKFLKQAGDQVKLVLIKQLNYSSNLSLSADTQINSPEPNTPNSIYSQNLSDRKSSSPVQSIAGVNKSSPPIKQVQQEQPQPRHHRHHRKPIQKELDSNPKLDECIQSPIKSNEYSTHMLPNLYSSNVNEKSNLSSNDPSSNSPSFVPTGQELLETQMIGLVDYGAAASVSNLINQWPNARLVTLYRNIHKHGNKGINLHQNQYPAQSIQTSDSSRVESNKSHGNHSVSGSLGLNIVGGDGSEATFVSHVQSDKPAGLSKRVFVGDRVLAVNGLDVTKYGHEQAAVALREARDRVDLLLVYSPNEYAEFEKHFSRQLQAVGHKISAKSLNRWKHQHESLAKEKDLQSNEFKQTERGGGTLEKTTEIKRSTFSGDQNARFSTADSSIVSDNQGLFLRCQVDYEPEKDSHHAVPKKAFALKSGDVLYVHNTNDSEWWQAQFVDPNKNELIGSVGLIPSRSLLERKERTRTRHVNFLARNSRSVELKSFRHFKSTNLNDENNANLLNQTDSIGLDRDSSLRTSVSTHSLNKPIRESIHNKSNDYIKSHTDRLGNSISSRRSRHKNRTESIHFPLSYIAVTPVHLSFSRPVVILGHLKDKIADELLCEFPDRFGTATPYTTRPRRPNEIEGRDYHFVISREIMVADIAAQRYLEAGEFNGNLYGTHLDSVVEVAKLGLHCLLDVGGPALKRLEIAGLPPIAILILPETLPTDYNKDSTQNLIHSKNDSKTDLRKHNSIESDAFKNLQVKLGRLLENFTTHLTAIITTDDFDVAYNRVKEIIFANVGPVVWLNSPIPIP